MRKKVVVAMSGGVDSSVTAAFLKDRGYDVVGITMNLYSLPPHFCKAEKVPSCCGWGAAEDAQHVASILNIPHYVADLRKPFEERVIDNFCREYARGRTPNPCIRCNQFIKFDLLLRKAEKLGADFVATGHHARVEFDHSRGKYLLKKGKDSAKDQSYFLYPLSQEKLARILMPVGDYTKKQVREIAGEKSLPVAHRPESQEICFVPDRDYSRFLKGRIPDAFRPGPILDEKKNVLGKHKGIAHFTVGQRRGIGISAPHPLFVLSIEEKENSIVVGTDDRLYKKTLVASDVVFISGEVPARPLEVTAKIRYLHRGARAHLIPLNSDSFLVEFDEPQRAITPGQAVVFYDDDVVLGGGTIEKLVS
ncbi:MAG: tRNA 2-thiouridine(34) synthase MnmA [Candidatus Aminicenantales bacterium]